MRRCAKVERGHKKFHENHEARTSILRMPASLYPYRLKRSGHQGGRTNGRQLLVAIHSNDRTKENIMTWETPTAVDFRYGFEITLYIANR